MHSSSPFTVVSKLTEKLQGERRMSSQPGLLVRPFVLLFILTYFLDDFCLMIHLITLETLLIMLFLAS